ncbi:Structural maintenance of chromosomes protein 5 [Podochytrium sp. JEL0797]|nr:Structural maintenance of chromosomes protein 5 [Podochytrium sp. JEL0797]
MSAEDKKRKSDAFQRIADCYIPGSILKITLTNFVTYNYVEFRPGPNLNMVIGPNGTGKSTIVCAIALGLGGKPEILGRAKELSEFVKKNQDQATIEIELKTNEGGSVIVERSFKTNSNTSAWKLDGRGCSEKQVREFIKKLNIQVDNLCQFLPQDKVSEFANMTPEKLLKETERAVGDSSLLISHETLIEKGKKVQELEKTFAIDTTTLATLLQKQSTLHEQVERLREREKHLHEAKLLQMAIPLAAYDQIRDEYTEVKNKKEAIAARKRDCEEKVRPVSEIVAALKAGAGEARQEWKQAQAVYTNEMRKVSKIVSDLDRSEESEKSHTRDVKVAKKEVADHEARVQNALQKRNKVQGDVDRMRGELERNGLMGGSGEIKDAQNSPEVLQVVQELQENTSLLNSIAQEVSALEELKVPIIESIQRLERRERAGEAELTGLLSAGNRKLATLRNMSNDAFKGVEWMRSNHGVQFEMPIFEPIGMGISATDPKYAQALESFIGYATMTSFVTQTQNDYFKLRNLLYEDLKLRVNVKNVDRVRSSFESPIRPENLARYGFDGVLIDYVKGDPVYLSALMQYTPVHETPICLNPRLDYTKVDRESGFKNYVHGDQSYSIRGAYGSSATKSETLRPAQMLGMEVDHERTSLLKRQIEQIRAEKLDWEQKLESLAAKRAIQTQKYEDTRAERVVLSTRKKELLNRRAAYDRSVAYLASVTDNWESCKIELENAKQRLDALSVSRLQFVFDRAKLNIEYVNQQVQSCKLFDSFVGSTFRKIQLDAEQTTAQKVEEKAKEENIEVNNQFIQIQTEFEELRRRTRQALERAKTAIPEEATEEDRKVVVDYKETKSVDELQVMLAQAKARAELLDNTDANVIVQYEKRQKEIANLTARHEEKEAQIAEDRAELEKIKKKWEPELRSLIKLIDKQFSASLEKIACTGEVKLATDDDYDKWRIEIFVSFRETERVQLLNKHRQSGGERSVTTITYLMALQQLSKAPFRVVDEINQGMDPKNERAVHAQMVDIACKKNSSQYFLITPKLLPDLTYHKMMKVLTIFNGDHQPERFDVEGFIEKKRRMV